MKLFRFIKKVFFLGLTILSNSAVCHYWFFKDIEFKFEEHVCNKCHDLLMIAYSLKDIAILNAKGNTYRCI